MLKNLFVWNHTPIFEKHLQTGEKYFVIGRDFEKTAKEIEEGKWWGAKVERHIEDLEWFKFLYEEFKNYLLDPKKGDIDRAIQFISADTGFTLGLKDPLIYEDVFLKATKQRFTRILEEKSAFLAIEIPRIKHKIKEFDDRVSYCKKSLQLPCKNRDEVFKFLQKEAEEMKESLARYALVNVPINVMFAIALGVCRALLDKIEVKRSFDFNDVWARSKELDAEHIYSLMYKDVKKFVEDYDLSVIDPVLKSLEHVLDRDLNLNQDSRNYFNDTLSVCIEDVSKFLDRKS